MSSDLDEADSFASTEEFTEGSDIAEGVWGDTIDDSLNEAPEGPYGSTETIAEFDSSFGSNRMDRRTISRLCAQQKLYETPALNCVLYLQHLNFAVIENLAPYKNLVTLFLNNNGIKRIQGLTTLTKLRMLYLNVNAIESIDGLERNTELTYLNLANNHVSTIENVAHLMKLETLNVSSNSLCTLESIKRIPSCLKVLDISNNRIESKECDLLEFLSSSQLLQFYSFGNPFSNSITQMRRKVVAACDRIMYLDKSPVSNEEREWAVAWVNGGKEAEKKVRIEQAVKKRSDMDKLVTDFRAMQFAEGFCPAPAVLTELESILSAYC